MKLQGSEESGGLQSTVGRKRNRTEQLTLSLFITKNENNLKYPFNKLECMDKQTVALLDSESHPAREKEQTIDTDNINKFQNLSKSHVQRLHII